MIKTINQPLIHPLCDWNCKTNLTEYIFVRPNWWGGCAISVVSRELSSLVIPADPLTLKICGWFNLHFMRPKTTRAKGNVSVLQQRLFSAAARNWLCGPLLKWGVYTITSVLLSPACGISSDVSQIVSSTKMWALVMDALPQTEYMDEKSVLVPPFGTVLQYCSSKLCIPKYPHLISCQAPGHILWKHHCSRLLQGHATQGRPRLTVMQDKYS